VLLGNTLTQIQAVFFIMVGRIRISKIYKVNVKFRAIQNLVINENTMEIDISINVLPVNGRANKEIIKKLSKHFNVKSSSIEIVNGKFRNTKRVKIKTEI